MEDHLDYLLTAYLLDSISEDGRRKVESHVAVCPKCRKELEEIRSTLSDVDNVLNSGNPEGGEYSFDSSRLNRILRSEKRRGMGILNLRVRKAGIIAASLILVLGLAFYLFSVHSLGRRAAKEVAQKDIGVESERQRTTPAVTQQIAGPSEPAGGEAVTEGELQEGLREESPKQAGEAEVKAPRESAASGEEYAGGAEGTGRPARAPASRAENAEWKAGKKVHTFESGGRSLEPFVSGTEEAAPGRPRREGGKGKRKDSLVTESTKSRSGRAGGYTAPPYDPTDKRSVKVYHRKLADRKEKTVRHLKPDEVTGEIPKGTSYDNLTNKDLSRDGAVEVFGMGGGGGGGAAGPYGNRSDRERLRNQQLKKSQRNEGAKGLRGRGKRFQESLGEDGYKGRLTFDSIEDEERAHSLKERGEGRERRNAFERMKGREVVSGPKAGEVPALGQYAGKEGYLFKGYAEDTNGVTQDTARAHLRLSDSYPELSDTSVFSDRKFSERQEKLLRGYAYYHSVDPDLTFDRFLGRRPQVPGPSLKNEGLSREQFRKQYGANPFVDTRLDHFSTFGMDVDTASYTYARNSLLSGKLPKPEFIRVEEVINSFPDHRPAGADSAFSVFCEGGPSPFGDGLELVMITVKARKLKPGERKNAVLTFAVDRSGSMAASVREATETPLPPTGESRLELVRNTLRTLVNSLRPNDRVAIVSYDTHPCLVLPHTAARNRSRILGAIDSLRPERGTNVEAGLELAYRVADEVFDPKALNRVILCSDGVANVGERGPEEILKKVKVFAGRGIYLSSVGFGMGKYNDEMLETLANKGNGNYAYVDSQKEAERIFRKNLPSTLQVLAEDSKIQADFNPEVVGRYRLLGYENRDIRDEDFRNDAVDAGEVGPGTTVTVLYEILRKRNAQGNIGKIYIRYRDTGTGRIEELNYPLKLGVLATRLSGTSNRFRFIACVAETAELLRGSYWARNGSFAHVREVLGTVDPGFFRKDASRLDFVKLLERAWKLSFLNLELLAQQSAGSEESKDKK